jgi:hypothetical protein
VSPGDVDFVQVITVMVVSPVAVATILHLDERRLRGEERALCWLPATRYATIFGASQVAPLYGCAGVVIHFTKTRWHRQGWGPVVGFLLGLLWAAAVLAVDVGSMALTAEVIDWLRL